MNERFHVGEIAIVRISFYLHLIGTECEVIEIVEPVIFDGIEHTYRVRCADGIDYLAASMHLRKRRPPQVTSGELRIMQLFDRSPDVVRQPDEEFA